jgi:hypothetical protein
MSLLKLSVLLSLTDCLHTYIHTLEEQNSFKFERGVIDGLFGLKIALHKRKEHGLSSWIVYVDLIKAFDSVSRESMYKVLSKLGVPDNLIALVVRLHTNCMVKIKAGDSDVLVESNVGVKQGDSLAPILFSLYFQACMEVLADECSIRLFVLPEQRRSCLFGKT